MATFTNNKNIVISVDPGFNSTKVVVNGLEFDIPNAILDVTGKTKEFLELGGTAKKTSGYLLSRYVPNKEYMVGELARKSSTEKTERTEYMVKHDMMDSKNRFETSDFEVSLMTCIGMAIIKYAKESIERHLMPEIHLENEDELLQYNFFIGIALPNDWVNDIRPTIQKFIVGNHDYVIETESGSYRLKYKIEETYTAYVSQAIAALIGTAYDDNGKMYAECATLKDLPAIIIDGGYKTMGIFMLTAANRVSAAESNTDYAMSNVHKKVAKILQDKYGRVNIFDFMIPSILENGGVVNYLCAQKSEDGQETGEVVSRQVDVTKLLEEAKMQICKEFIEYMDDKYDNFLDVKQVIITGGTGAAYYNQLSTFLSEKRSHLKGKIVLTDYEFLDSKIDPIYGVSVGLYKILKNQINRAFKRANKENETIPEVTGVKKEKAQTKEQVKKEQPAMEKLKNRPVTIVEED